MYLNQYPSYYKNSIGGIYQGLGGLGKINVNGRESVITVSSPFLYNYNYNYNQNYNFNQPNNQIVAPFYLVNQMDRQDFILKPPTPTPIKLDPTKLLLKPQMPQLSPKPKSRPKMAKTSTTSLINPKNKHSKKKKTSINKSTSTTNLILNKANVYKTDKSTQTQINKIKFIALKKEQRPPIPPTIINIDKNIKREEKKQKVFKKISSTSSSPLSRPMSNISEKSIFSTISTATNSTNITKLKFLGVTRCDPNEYKSRYQSSLVSSKNIPGMLNQIINTNVVNANNFHRLSNRLRSPLYKTNNLNEKFG